MAKLAFLSSTTKLVELVQEKAPSFRFEIDCHVVTQENVIRITKKLIAKGTDAIITRGLQAHLIRKDGIDIPLIEMHLTPHDLIVLLLRAAQHLKDPHALIAVICLQEIERDVFFFGRKLDVNFKIYPVDSASKQYSMADLAIKEGAGFIISSLPVLEYVQEKGIPTLLLMPGESSIRHTFEIAEKVAFAIDIEKQKTAEASTIFNFSFDAMIVIDKQARIISMNPVAIRLFKIAETDVYGYPLTKIIPVDAASLHKALDKREEIYSRLIKYKNVAYVFNLAPILVDKNADRAIISIQEYNKLERTETDVRKQIYLKGHVAKYDFAKIIGESEKILRVKQIAQHYARHNSTVLIEGQSGTGKELFAQSIHNASKRSKNPFVTVNCAAIPENLIESELFGYVDGAFTGALKKGKRGLFDLAHTGTIFLDEISELSNYSQQRFLRVIQERNICRIGDDKVIPIDVRVIAATNKNLESLVEQGKFRDDLYYRLNVLSLKIPPLRERREDIAVLFSHYLNRFGKELKKSFSISDTAIEALTAYSWSGNVRQLRNFCEKLAIVSDDQTINGETILNLLYETYSKEGSATESAPPQLPVSGEAHEIIRLLEAFQGNRERVAEELGISKTTLWRKIRAYRIRESYSIGQKNEDKA